MYNAVNNYYPTDLRPPPSLPLQREQSQSFHPSQYRLPWTVGTITTPALREQMIAVSDAATSSQKALKMIWEVYRKRYNCLCPESNWTVYLAHCVAISRLLQWRDSYLGKHTQPPFNVPGTHHGIHQTLAPPPKLPPFLVKDIVLHEPTYRAFYNTVSTLKQQYLAGPNAQWTAAKRHTELLLIESPLSDAARRQWFNDWLSYRNTAKRWEFTVAELKIATWELISGEIKELIDIAVEKDWYGDIQPPVSGTKETDYADLVPLQIPSWEQVKPFQSLDEPGYW
jgi:hypothetical protein